jgi:hypothetical protein
MGELRETLIAAGLIRPGVYPRPAPERPNVLRLDEAGRNAVHRPHPTLEAQAALAEAVERWKGRAAG